MRMRSRYLRAALLLMVFALVVTACGGGSDGSSSAEQPTSDEAGGDTTQQETAGEEETQEELEEITLTQGGVPASSSVFAYFVAQSRHLEDYDGAMTVNVRETTSGSENLGLITEDAIDYGVGTPAQVVESGRDDLRMLMVYYQSADFYIVRKDTGITGFGDLEGRKFAPGLSGAGSTDRVNAILDALEIQPDKFEGSLEDIVNAMKDRRIEGYSKSGNGLRADATMLDVASAVDVDLIGFTPEEVATLKEKMPDLQFVEAPADVLPGTKPHTTTRNIAIYFTDTDMSDEVAYRLTKALWNTIEAASDAANFDPTRGHTYEGTIAVMNQVPLHPGAERFYKEVGAL